MLEHAYPISVQVDALIALVAAFHPSEFHLYWTRENVVHMRYVRMSTIWEGCIKCFLPADPLFYLCALVVTFVGCLVRGQRRRCFLGA